MKGVLQTKDYQHFTIVDENDPSICLHTFEGAMKAKGCLPGDVVEWKNEGCIQHASGHHDLLVGTLELASKTTYGLNARGHSLYLFIPYNRAYPQFIVGSSEKDRSCHRLGTIKYESWDASKSQFPRGSLQVLFGPCGDLKAEEEALRWYAHPWPSLRNKHVEPIIPKDDCPNRIRIIGTTFNIDPVGCKDVDDVITIEPIGIDTYTIIITIADVAAHIQELSATDVLASTFGQTLYKDGEAICPMIPTSYSEDMCSLLAKKERKGVSLSFEWNCTRSTVEKITWFESIFVNNKSYTYEEFQTSTSQERHILAHVASDIEGKELLDAHEWIETMMKFYNTHAGKQLREAGVGILRRHTAPIQERLQKYVQWDPSLSKLAQSAAEYCSADSKESSHFGIGVDAYCHASSPIRRYADLMNQRLLKQLIRGNKEGLFVTVPIDDLNQRAKAAKAYEKNLLFLQNVLGDERYLTGARILDIQEDKVSLWISQWQKKVSICMKRNMEGKFVSADEKTVHELAEGDLVNISFALNLAGRHWKERMIIKIE